MKIVAANLWNLNRQQQRAIRQCLTDDPDVIVLPELRNNEMSAAQALLAAEGYTLCHAPVNRTICLGTASRIPIQHWAIVDQGAFVGRPQIKLHLGNNMTVWGIHLDAPVSPRRYRRRRQQLSSLADLIIESQVPTALAGDFNTYFSESVFQTFLTRIGSRNSDRTDHKHQTWPSILPLFQIDHILCSSHLTVTQLQPGAFNGSDHLPIYGYVEADAT